MKKTPTDQGGAVTVRALCALAVLLAVPVLLLAVGPQWWIDRGVIDPGAVANDYAPANQGQVKNFALAAYQELQADLPAAAWTNATGTTLTAFATHLATLTNNNYAPINLGQLKTVAQPFYDQLIAVGYTTNYPWSTATTLPSDYAIANIGQVKNLFSFDTSTPAAPYDVTATVNGPNEVDLSWTDPANSSATAILVQQQNVDGTWSTIATLPPNTTSYAVTGLTTGQSYLFRIVAVNSKGSYGVQSPVAPIPDPVTPQNPPPPPRYAVIDLGAGMWPTLMNNNGAVVLTDESYISYVWDQGQTNAIAGDFPIICGIDDSGQLYGESSYTAAYWADKNAAPTICVSTSPGWITSYTVGKINGQLIGTVNDGLNYEAWIFNGGIGNPLIQEPPLIVESDSDILQFGTDIDIFYFVSAVAGNHWLGSYGNDPGTGPVNVAILVDGVSLPGTGGAVINASGIVAETWSDGGNGPVTLYPSGEVVGPGTTYGINDATTPQIVGTDNIHPAVIWDKTNLDGTPAANYVAKDLNQLISTDAHLILTGASGINNSSIITGTATADGSNSIFVAGPHGVMLIPAGISVDADRNGTIVMVSDAATGLPVDTTSQGRPFRFWINDGVDGYCPTSGETSVQDDLQPTTGSLNYEQLSVTCPRDLENFARLWLYTKGLSQAISSGQIIIGLEWDSNTGDAANGWGANDGAPAINIYKAAPPHGSSTVTGGTEYLTDSATATDQTGATYGGALGAVAKGQPFYFPASTFANLTDSNPKTFFLFEGTARGTGRLVITFNTVSSGVYTKIGQGGAVYMDLKDIKELYERYTVGDGNGGSPTASATISTARLPSGATALTYSTSAPGLSDPSDQNGNKYILFVHGWNMAPWERDAFAETALKRLYWQGYKGKFGAFQWPTTYTTSSNEYFSDAQEILAYDDGEYSAWQSAVPLRGLFSQLNGKYGGLYLLAHSMGNVVAGEAMRIAGQSGSGQIVNTYVASQAAVPGHCYDSTLTGNDLLSFGPLGIYGPSTPNIYNNWMMPTNPAMAGKANFYNVNDYALHYWQSDQVTKPDIRYYTYYYNGSASDNPAQDLFYKAVVPPIAQIQLHLGNATNVQDRYEIMAYDSEPRSKALGGVADAAGFTSQNLPSLWPADTFSQPNGPYSAHPWHSAQFRFANSDQKNYWDALLNQFQLLPSQ